MVGLNDSFLRRLTRPRVFVPTLLGLMVVGASISYYLLLHPESAFMRLFRSSLPEKFSMITIGPYPQTAEDYERIKSGGVKYLVALLDPSLPYEKPMLEREQRMASEYGLIVKFFPMFPMDSMLDTELLSGSLEAQKAAVEFLSHLDAPAYVHCYLGRHRALRVRDEVLKAGVPEDYFFGSEVERRISQAWEAYRRKDFVRVLVLLDPVTAKDVDILSLRGWAYYRLQLFSMARESFRQGLEIDPSNPRNRLGLGYCYLREGEAVMAQKQFAAVLEQVPNETDALIGQGLAYLAMQNKFAAAQMFRAALEKNPHREEVKGYLRQAESP